MQTEEDYRKDLIGVAKFKPEVSPDNKDSNATSTASKVGAIIAIMAIIILSLPFIICGAFASPWIPLVTIGLVIFAVVKIYNAVLK